MTLWEYIKKKMLEHPTQVISEKGASMTYEDLCIFAEFYGKKLKAQYYGSLCNNEMSRDIGTAVRSNRYKWRA